MSDHSETERRPRSRRLLTLIGAAVAALLLATATGVIILTQLNAPASQRSAQAPAPSAQRDIPLSAGRSEGAGLLTASNAEAVVAVAVNVKTTDADGADALKKQLAKVVRGAYLLELQDQQQEFDVNGWKLKGDAKVVSLEVGKIKKTQKATKANVRACIDTSDTRLVDSEGEPILKQNGPTRALHIFTLSQNSDGTWAVVKHTFPNNPAC